MRAVVQRVSQARVDVDGECVAQIAGGLLVLLGAEKGDDRQSAAFLADKLLNLRIFEDSTGKMNLSVQDVDGELLIVSQFTLLADCRKGRRPSFDNAAPPEEAIGLYEYFVQLCSAARPVKTGRFAAHMLVSLTNDGPVTILLDSKKVF